MVIVTTDHGHDLGERGIFGKQYPHFDTHANIPLFVWHPERLSNGQRISALTRPWTYSRGSWMRQVPIRRVQLTAAACCRTSWAAKSTLGRGFSTVPSDREYAVRTASGPFSSRPRVLALSRGSFAKKVNRSIERHRHTPFHESRPMLKWSK